MAQSQTPLPQNHVQKTAKHHVHFHYLRQPLSQVLEPEAISEDSQTGVQLAQYPISFFLVNNIAFNTLHSEHI
jgi:hypothetical protein